MRRMIFGYFLQLGKESRFSCIIGYRRQDALQLVSQDVTVLLNRRGTTDMQIFDPEEVEKVYGLRPDQIIDLKALMGDSSDNIPGVPGVGEKTALKLLSQYSTLEHVYDNIDQISGKRLRENLNLYREQAFLSRELATIIKDVPIDFNLKDCSYEIPKSPELRDILEELEFKSIISKLDFDDDGRSSKILERSKETIEVKGLDQLSNYVKQGLVKERIGLIFDDSAITFSWDKNQVYHIKLFRDMLDDGLDYYDVLKGLEPILKAQGVGKIVHDGKKLLLEASKLGIEISNLLFDTYIAAYLLDPTHTRYDIRYLLYEYLGIEVDIVDAADLLLLADDFKERLRETGMEKLYKEVEHPLIQVLADMEITGFKVNEAILRELDVEFTAILEDLTKEIYEIAGQEFNINSPKQLGEILFEKLGLPVVRRTKTGYSTNIEVLEQLRDQHVIIEKIIEYRQVMKLKSTYIDGLLSVIDPGTEEFIQASIKQ